METQKILVTGGSGLIGKHVCEIIKDRGHEPIIFDLKMMKNSNYEFIKGDVTKLKEIKNAIKISDGVIHMASMIGVKNTELEPRKTLDVIIQGTKNVVDNISKEKRMVFTSTSEVYGDANKIPTDENQNYSPKSVYGVAKCAAEEYVKNTLDNFTIVRYFNVYGPKQSNEFVIKKFINLAYKGENLKIYGEGSQVRSFVHVKDVAMGTVMAYFSKAGENQIFNLGNSSEPISMENLANKVINLTNSQSKIEKISFEKSDRNSKREIYKRIPDITKANRLIGYQPTISLDEGLVEIWGNIKD